MKFIHEKTISTYIEILGFGLKFYLCTFLFHAACQDSLKPLYQMIVIPLTFYILKLTHLDHCTKIFLVIMSWQTCLTLYHSSDLPSTPTHLGLTYANYFIREKTSTQTGNIAITSTSKNTLSSLRPMHECSLINSSGTRLGHYCCDYGM